MSKFSRREVVGGAAAAGLATSGGSSLVYAQVDRPTEGPPPTPLDGQNLPSFRFALGEQTPLQFAGGSLNEATVDVFPVSDKLAGALMVLEPGGLRELHWHSNYAEWAYVIEGNIRGTVTTGNGEYQTADFGPGDVWYFPTGFGHSALNLGDTPARAILVFDNGNFADYGIFSITGWTSWVSPAVLAKNFGVPEATFANFPKDRVVIAKGPVPPVSGGTPPNEVSTASLDHRYAMLDQSPEEFPGGTRRVVSREQFPVSTTMSGALLQIKPGGMRALHWHRNAAEFSYFLKGKGEMTVFASTNRSRTEEFTAGDIGYVPQNYGHYIENTGESDLEVLQVWDNGDFEEISLAKWIANHSPELLATNFGVPASTFDDFLKSPGPMPRK